VPSGAPCGESERENTGRRYRHRCHLRTPIALRFRRWSFCSRLRGVNRHLAMRERSLLLGGFESDALRSRPPRETEVERFANTRILAELRFGHDLEDHSIGVPVVLEVPIDLI
jgi:hypothetical protein